MSEQEARQWIRDVLDVVARGVALTPTPFDDKVVVAVAVIVDNDLAWLWIWKVLQKAIGTDPELVMAEAVESEVEPEVASVCVQAGITPLDVVTLVTMIIEIVKFLRERV